MAFAGFQLARLKGDEVNGPQLLALAPGGHHFMETNAGDDAIASALST